MTHENTELPIIATDTDNKLSAILRVLSKVKDETTHIRIDMGKIENAISNMVPKSDCQNIQMESLKENGRKWDKHYDLHKEDLKNSTAKWDAHQKVHEIISVSFGKIFAVACAGGALGTTVCGALIAYLAKP